MWVLHGGYALCTTLKGLWGIFISLGCPAWHAGHSSGISRFAGEAATDTVPVAAVLLYTMPALLKLSLLAAVPAALASPAQPTGLPVGAPTVTISHPQATIVGAPGPGVDMFNGIPFAVPPTGTGRLRPPQPIQTPMGTVEAIKSAKSCPQFSFDDNSNSFVTSLLGNLTDNPLVQKISNSGEDCLTVDIRRPSGTKAGANLPVLVWIYGGGFESGSTSSYDGTSFVANSIQSNMPVIFVAMNYRLGGFGFLAGSEILNDGAANLGLLDQRLAIEWVADNIAPFGGDPSKVTIWGESAGSISVFDQMALYDGNNTYKGASLFRSAIMDSGSIVPADPVDGVKGQAIYDAVVSYAGCSGAPSTLECLRGLSYTKFLNAVNSVPNIMSYHSIALSYLPRPDGTVLTDSPEKLVLASKYASVPFIVGDQEDEGTLFSLFQNNLTTKADVVDYLASLFFFDATRQQIEDLVALYPNITTDGSPFRTGSANNWYPQYKRLAAILGDLAFTISRRAFLTYAEKVKPNVPFWSYLSSYAHGTPILGTFHGTDIVQVFFGVPPDYPAESFHAYYLSFIYDQDPNSQAAGYMNWPQWSANRSLMQFFKNHGALLADDFRQPVCDYLLANVQSFHI